MWTKIKLLMSSLICVITVKQEVPKHLDRREMQSTFVVMGT